MNNLPKYFNGTDKIVQNWYLKHDTIVDGWLMYTSDNMQSPFMTGSQQRGTQKLKVYKSVATAQKAFAKMHDDNNASKYVLHYYKLVVVQ